MGCTDVSGGTDVCTGLLKNRGRAKKSGQIILAKTVFSKLPILKISSRKFRSI